MPKVRHIFNNPSNDALFFPRYQSQTVTLGNPAKRANVDTLPWLMLFISPLIPELKSYLPVRAKKYGP
ncbi:hypothetical protein BRE01_68320 [Brevibacillus reuszeri]|uniref:Transposase n=1 Tax=Brevibacillus reuszeri TaxID=54915 RepID=A0ABQ0TZU7_9BACL|nr:hypothetical protein BRE01_68320 [Brevibacillus reuszeri]